MKDMDVAELNVFPDEVDAELDVFGLFVMYEV
jgi:hypothetical protein